MMVNFGQLTLPRHHVCEMLNNLFNHGRGGNDNHSTTNSTTNRTTSGVSAADNNDNSNAGNVASVISKITERGLQNGHGLAEEPTTTTTTTTTTGPRLIRMRESCGLSSQVHKAQENSDQQSHTLFLNRAT